MVVLDVDDREHRAAQRAGGPRLLQRLPPVDRHRLRAGVRLAAAARRPPRRPLRPQVGLHRRPARLRRRLGHRRCRELVRACSSRHARSRACSAPCSRPRRSRLLSTTFTRPVRSAARRSASSARSPAAAPAVGLLLGGILTEWLSWRWCLYVNLLFAIPAAIGAFQLLRQPRRSANRPQTGSARARSTASTRPVRARVRLLELRDALVGPPGDDHHRSALAVVLLTRVRRSSSRASKHPLLPLRVIARPHARRLLPGDRDRGHRDVRGVPVPDLLPAADQGLHADPDRAGVPADDRWRSSSPPTSVNIKLPGQGRAAAAAGAGHVRSARSSLVWFAQITPTSSYVGHILPGADRHGRRHGQHLRPGARQRDVRGGAARHAASRRRW